MKKLKQQLKSVSKSLATLSEKVDKITQEIEKLAAPKKTAAIKKPAAPAKKAKAPATKTAPEKPKTVLESVYETIRRSRNGASIAKLKEKTGLTSRQLSNALYKLSKKGTILSKSRGVHVKK